MARDTDADWRFLAETDPYFAVLTLDQYHADQIGPAQLDEFYRSGQEDMALALTRIRQQEPGFRSHRALDFGCGVGRLTLAMAGHAADVVGLDIAPGMLAGARKAAQQRGVGNVRFAHDLTPEDRFDWVNSFIVLQHIPPARGMAIIGDLLARLDVGGFCSLHVTLFRIAGAAAGALRTRTHWFYDGERMQALVEKDRDRTGVMGMYDYDLNRVLAIMIANGINPYALSMTDHGGNHGAWVFGHRSPERYAVELQHRYVASGESSFTRLLGSGWAIPEEWGVWTDGTDAVLELQLPGGRGAVCLEGRAFVVPEKHPRLSISVEVNGSPAAYQSVSADDPAVSLTVPAGLANERGVLRLRVQIDRPRSPFQFGISSDDRMLGFGLEAVTILG